MATGTTATTWTNWGGNQTCAPVEVVHARSEDEIAAAVGRAAARGLKVKPTASGHSFTDIACTDGMMLRLEDYNRVLGVDAEKLQVTVEAGITINRLGAELALHGMAQPNLGDIGYQTISGAISTATHGTGGRLTNLSSQVVALSLVLADGRVLRCSPDDDLETFKAAQVSLGALGVISTVTLQCVPAFRLHAVEDPRRLDDILDNFEQLVAENDHFEAYWLTHTDRAIALINNRTEEPLKPKSRVGGYIDDILLENHLFGLMCGIGKLRPRWIPAINRFEARVVSHSEFTDRSDLVFTNPRFVRFVEMEYALPRAALPQAMRELRDMIARRNLNISFPVEMRAVAPDDITLSTAYGRETSYIAVHVFRGMPFEAYFREVEAIMNGVEGRPHWGKMHYRSAADLKPAYPKWDDFIAMRNRLDPERRFGNAYLNRVLGD